MQQSESNSGAAPRPGHGRRDRPADAPRRAWFVAFEREFQAIAADVIGAAPAVRVSENEWRVWLESRSGRARTVSIDLPPNYDLFQPAAVALNTALRLRAAFDDAGDTPAGAAPHRP